MQTYQVWPSHFVHSHGIVQFDVQILVHALQSAADLDFVLELHGNFMLDERLEKAAAFLLATAGFQATAAGPGREGSLPEEQHAGGSPKRTRGEGGCCAAVVGYSYSPRAPWS